FVSLDPTAGHEQQGRRPIMVVSRSHPSGSTLRLVVPITTGGRAAAIQAFVYPLPAGMKTVGGVLCHQLRCLDLSARGAQWHET
ncbi:type II toxin-antitoxin system PemK/MazF family toxin, partial [Mycobacterium tuberculosis]|nr:type II toxin-antitoxin system PemK/MazF family toxin [Mycobacterium tuberculosis]